MWKCNWEFVGEKCEHFFRRNVCIFDDPCLFHVWTIRRGMSDTPETMGGLSGSTNCTPS